MGGAHPRGCAACSSPDAESCVEYPGLRALLLKPGHSRLGATLGLAVFQKNNLEQVRQLRPTSTGLSTSSAANISECSSLQSYLAAGKPVLNAEYRSARYPGFCTPGKKNGIMGALFDVALDGRTFKPCWTLRLQRHGSPRHRAADFLNRGTLQRLAALRAVQQLQRAAAIPRANLVRDRRDMTPYRHFGNTKFDGDLGGRLARTPPPKHLELAGSQVDGPPGH